MVVVTVDPSQIRKLERTVLDIKNGVPRVLAPAINRALDKGRTVIKREIRKEYIIRAKDIPVKVRGANTGRLSGQVEIKDTMIALNKFRVRPSTVTKRKRMMHVEVRRGQGGDIPHGFIARTNQYLGPFVRQTTRSLPIRKLLAIGAAIMASQPSVAPAANKAMGDQLAKSIDQQINRVMRNAGGHS
jgi:hypothetical protein